MYMRIILYGHFIFLPSCAGYGLTECVAGLSISPFRTPTPSGSVGKLLPGIEARIVDPDSGRDVIAGSSGELWMRGKAVMRGYYRKPDRTAATVDSNGWLHTGREFWPCRKIRMFFEKIIFSYNIALKLNALF